MSSAPSAVRDGPLCEAATAGFGIGLALAGHPTIVEIEFLDFITLVTDALVNQAAKMRILFRRPGQDSSHPAGAGRQSPGPRRSTARALRLGSCMCPDYTSLRRRTGRMLRG